MNRFFLQRLGRHRWITLGGLVLIAAFVIGLQQYACGRGISVDSSSADQLYAAQHLKQTFLNFPKSLITLEPLPAYPAILALVAKLRHVDPVQTVSLVNAVLTGMVIPLVGWPGVPELSLSVWDTAVFGALFLPLDYTARAEPWTLAWLLLFVVGISLGRSQTLHHRLLLGLAMVLVAALVSRVVLAFAIFQLVLLLANRGRKPPEPRMRGFESNLVLVLTCLAIILCCSWHALQVARQMRVAPDRYGHATWRESKTVLLLKNLPPDIKIYTNLPDAVRVCVDREAFPAPGFQLRSATTQKLAEAMDQLQLQLQSSRAVYVLFTNVPKNANSSVEPSDLLPNAKVNELPDARVYSSAAAVDVAVAEIKTHRAGYDPARAWTPSRRSGGYDTDWLKRHEEFSAIAAQGGVDLLFLGDSITDDVRQENKVPGGTALFNERFGKYHPANFGIDHDMTQHLLFRILNGECPGTLHPRVAVMLIGTNNTGEDSPEAIAHGVHACIEAVRKQMPGTKILLMGEFPRSAHADSEKRAILKQVNELISKLDDGEAIRYLNIYDKFLDSTGELSKSVMYDLLHPSLKGYQIWFDAMQPLLDEMMTPSIPHPSGVVSSADPRSQKCSGFNLARSCFPTPIPAYTDCVQ